MQYPPTGNTHLPVLYHRISQWSRARTRRGVQRQVGGLPGLLRQFADSFLDSWSRELSSAGPASKSTYSSVAADSPPTACDPPHRQGQPTTIALPGEGLRVFIRLEAGAPARAQSSYAIRTLIPEKLGNISNKIRQVFQIRSGWAVQTADPETRDHLVEKQAEWAAELGATTVETNKEWFTYVISDFPRRLTDFYGNEVDSGSIISDEIEIQTGLKPVDIRPSRQVSDNPLTKTLLVSFLKPTKRYWSLFGSRATRLIDKTDRLRQCETCWDYHSVRHCYRQPVCQRCGKTGYTMDDCTAPEQRINCLGPHAAGFRATRTCPDSRRRDVPTTLPGTATETQQDAAELQRDNTALYEQPSARAPSPAASGAPSCIMVATTPSRATKRMRSPNILDQVH
ncbi:hypothetical protein FOPG_18692 [Fusarium oxysporum f. sp. conglutinans race 2 54008]|uniref:CCHC-type domain-containing protein n=1 Tax=Fusarium oxysporum f. sp. conglutinans race 2 54008 TaxID=1089457 RepID=X0GP31_FUSOX|nr:hypothetical protein FOPG_18692 [Fusarium oxysporum f. sp. conglutinans race 2 54008]